MTAIDPDAKPSCEVRQPYRLCVAPMMAWTDRHCRAMHRLLAPSARLYTEMITTDALLFGDAERRLAFDPAEHPVALQLGGSDPNDLARAARLGECAGFDEVNLNVGCPSERVRKGAIGACLMRAPERVAAGVAAMRAAVRVPVTVKCRLGVEDAITARSRSSEEEEYGPLRDFVGTVAAAGVDVFIVHARKAVLEGLTPAQNRAVPPLHPQRVARLAADFPHLVVVVNGGIRDSDTARRHLAWAHGVMIGRGAYRNPLWLSRLNAELFGDQALAAEQALDAYLPYVERRLRDGVPLHDMTRHLMTLFNGLRGARRFRRHLAEHDGEPGAGIDVLLEAAKLVLDAANGRRRNRGTAPAAIREMPPRQPPSP